MSRATPRLKWRQVRQIVLERAQTQQRLASA
jgi:hypothetical protein